MAVRRFIGMSLKVTKYNTKFSLLKWIRKPKWANYKALLSNYIGNDYTYNDVIIASLSMYALW